MKRAILVPLLIILGMIVTSHETLGETKKQTLKLKTKDEIKFKVDFYEAENPNSPTVLILPGMSGHRKPYGKISKQLNASGFNVLSINYYKLDRGYNKHKERKKVLKKRGGTEGIIENEVATSLQFLKSKESVDPKKIGILGCSMGTWVGFQTMAKFPDVKCLAMLSPICAVSGKSFRTYEGTKDLAEAFGTRYLLLVGSEKDRHSSKSPSATEKAEYLASIMPNAKIEKKYYSGKSHGYFILKDHKDLNGILVDWFNRSLGKTGG